MPQMEIYGYMAIRVDGEFANTSTTFETFESLDECLEFIIDDMELSDLDEGGYRIDKLMNRRHIEDDDDDELVPSPMNARELLSERTMREVKKGVIARKKLSKTGE